VQRVTTVGGVAAQGRSGTAATDTERDGHKRGPEASGFLGELAIEWLDYSQLVGGSFLGEAKGERCV
jgi:hypothetical protein